MANTLSNRGRSTNVFDDFRRELGQLAGGLFDDSSYTAVFEPRVNLAETATSYEVVADLPGLKAEEVEVEFHDGNLWITGTRQRETEEEGKKFHRIERRYGQFRRVISLGNEVDADNIEAAYKDGVLTINVPKVAAAQPKKIAVKR
jgi:HSP20 family protein